jgi:hypothetical protein
MGLIPFKFSSLCPYTSLKTLFILTRSNRLSTNRLRAIGLTAKALKPTGRDSQAQPNVGISAAMFWTDPIAVPCSDGIPAFDCRGGSPIMWSLWTLYFSCRAFACDIGQLGGLSHTPSMLPLAARVRCVGRRQNQGRVSKSQPKSPLLVRSGLILSLQLIKPIEWRESSYVSMQKFKITKYPILPP